MKLPDRLMDKIARVIHMLRSQKDARDRREHMILLTSTAHVMAEEHELRIAALEARLDELTKVDQ